MDRIPDVVSWLKGGGRQKCLPHSLRDANLQEQNGQCSISNRQVTNYRQKTATSAPNLHAP